MLEVVRLFVGVKLSHLLLMLLLLLVAEAGKEIQRKMLPHIQITGVTLALPRNRNSNQARSKKDSSEDSSIYLTPNR